MNRVNKLTAALAIVAAAYVGIQITHPAVQEVYMPSVIEGDNTDATAALIRNLWADQTVVLHVSGYGGDVTDGYQIINAMRETRGHAIVKVEGLAASMYALITAEAQEVILEENAIVMFHAVQAGGGPVPIDHPFQKNLLNRLMQTGLFTPSEVCAIGFGAEVYLTKNDYEARNKHRMPFDAIDCSTIKVA